MYFCNLLLTIWALCPIMALTDDTCFLSSKSTDSNHKYRFSIVNLLLGECQFQFLSFQIEDSRLKFQIYRFSRMSDMNIFSISEEKLSDLRVRFENHYGTLSDSDIQLEREALLRQIQTQQARQNISNSKINTFTAVVLVLLPLLITRIDWSVLHSLQKLEQLILLLLAYSIVNICFWLFQSLKVRGYCISSYSDLKVSINKNRMFNWQLYYDYQQQRRESDKQVSFVSYVYEWLICTVVLSLLYTMLHFTAKPTITSVSEYQVYTFSVNTMDIAYDHSAVEWAKIMYQLQTDQYQEVVILSNQADCSELSKTLEKFTHQKIEWLPDPTLESDTVKIILEVSYAG